MLHNMPHNKQGLIQKIQLHLRDSAYRHQGIINYQSR